MLVRSLNPHLITLEYMLKGELIAAMLTPLNLLLAKIV
jgi:hypothetical protein